jgi:hypothetical protein
MRDPRELGELALHPRLLLDEDPLNGRGPLSVECRPRQLVEEPDVQAFLALAKDALGVAFSDELVGELLHRDSSPSPAPSLDRSGCARSSRAAWPLLGSRERRGARARGASSAPADAELSASPPGERAATRIGAFASVASTRLIAGPRMARTSRGVEAAASSSASTASRPRN